MSHSNPRGATRNAEDSGAAKPQTAANQAANQIVWLDAAQGAGKRLDQFLASQLPQYSRSRLQRWIALGAVNCDTRALSAKTRLTGQEKISVEPQPFEADEAFAPEPVPFEVVYEDESVLVINKHAGLVVHPAPGNWSGTLMNGLLHTYPRQKLLPRAGIVHRLDKDTSGLMVVARNERAMDSLVRQLSARSVSRRYLAVCHGHARPLHASGPIGRDARNRLRMAVRADGKPAGTDCKPLCLGTVDAQPVSLVHCRLQTGRTHQIRVHLADAGYPLIGDRLYGGASLAGFDHQALHAYGLAFDHAETGETMQQLCGLPANWQAVIDAAGWQMPGIEALRGLAVAQFPAS